MDNEKDRWQNCFKLDDFEYDVQASGKKFWKPIIEARFEKGKLNLEIFWRQLCAKRVADWSEKVWFVSIGPKKS